MDNVLRKLVAPGLLLCLAACSPDDSGQGDLHLPQGDADRGKAHFVTLGCVNCHHVVGADLPETGEAGPVRVILGSRTGRQMTYGQLVTSITNPSHRLASRYRDDEVSVDGASLMTSYNDTLTVTQLTDLVAFLKAHYQIADRPGYRYPVYTYQADDESADAGQR